jgi:hypothetical protein
MTGVAAAQTTVWNLVGPATGNWNAAANWTEGVPLASDAGKAVFNVAGAAECIVATSVSVGMFAMGDNQTNNGTFLRIVNGGTLTTSKADWSAVGYNRVASLTVEAGGKLVTAHRLFVGRDAFASAGGLPSYLVVDGGTAEIGQNLQMGLDNGYGILTVDGGGLVNIKGSLTMGGDMLIDVRNGTIIINGNLVGTIGTWVTNGKIVAYGGAGTVVYDYNVTNAGKTTISAEPAPLGNGDVNGDGRVDAADLLLFAAEWFQANPDLDADFTRDGNVDMSDFQILAANWHFNEFSRTLTGKIMCGYQGWFNCPGDGTSRGWVHWGASNKFEPGFCTVDWWPDMSEYDADEKFATGFKYADNSTAYVFSSYKQKTVLRHFSWMAQYGIDGVFLQRFATETTPGSAARSHRDQVMLHCRKGGNQYKRAWAMMYDLSGLASGADIQKVVNDWKYLVDTFKISKDPADSAYLHHNGKPVVAIWGLGFGRVYEGQQSYELINFLKNDPVYGGCTVMVGVNNNWRTNSDSWFRQTVQIADIISPWAVGRYGSKNTSELNNFTVTYTVPDQTWCNANSKDYLPVVFPGFSWQNLQQNNKFDQTPRLGGRFLWRQYYKAIAEGGATMIYQAMFDEVDEGTAVFKCTNAPPVAETPYVTMSTPFLPTGNAQFAPYDISDALLPSDHYLWLVGQGTKMLRRDIPLSETMPMR